SSKKSGFIQELQKKCERQVQFLIKSRNTKLQEGAFPFLAVTCQKQQNKRCSHRSPPHNNGLLETSLQKPHFVCADVVVCQPPIPHLLFVLQQDFILM
ncbi:MAG: hypothetical protein J6Y60_05620, partial [Treponema sp.]|nr:hypothetical protein [Treponema sp.]